MIYLNGWIKFYDYKGVASRKEFLAFYVINIIIGRSWYGYIGYLNFELLLFIIGIFICNISLFVRRLHDAGRNGQYFFLAFIPIGNLYLLYLLLQRTVIENNKYRVNDERTETTAE